MAANPRQPQGLVVYERLHADGTRSIRFELGQQFSPVERGDEVGERELVHGYWFKFLYFAGAGGVNEVMVFRLRDYIIDHRLIPIVVTGFRTGQTLTEVVLQERRGPTDVLGYLGTLTLRQRVLVRDLLLATFDGNPNSLDDYLAPTAKSSLAVYLELERHGLSDSWVYVQHWMRQLEREPHCHLIRTLLTLHRGAGIEVAMLRQNEGNFTANLSPQQMRLANLNPMPPTIAVLIRDFFLSKMYEV